MVVEERPKQSHQGKVGSSLVKSKHGAPIPRIELRDARACPVMGPKRWTEESERRPAGRKVSTCWNGASFWGTCATTITRIFEGNGAPPWLLNSVEKSGAVLPSLDTLVRPGPCDTLFLFFGVLHRTVQSNRTRSPTPGSGGG